MKGFLILPRRVMEKVFQENGMLFRFGGLENDDRATDGPSEGRKD